MDYNPLTPRSSSPDDAPVVAVARKGVKRPAPPPFDDSEDDEDVPDLHSWLVDQGYSLAEQITLCRAHASYCAAVLKPFKAKRQ